MVRQHPMVRRICFGKWFACFSGKKVRSGNHLPVVQELRSEVSKLNEGFEYHKNESARKTKRINELCAQVEALQRETAGKSRKGLRPGEDNAKAFNTLLKLCGGMAMAIYGFRPDDKRSRVATEIQSDLDLKGINLDADTIRKYLKESAKLLKAAEEQGA